MVQWPCPSPAIRNCHDPITEFVFSSLKLSNIGRTASVSVQQHLMSSALLRAIPPSRRTQKCRLLNVIDRRASAAVGGFSFNLRSEILRLGNIGGRFIVQTNKRTTYVLIIFYTGCFRRNGKYFRRW